MVRNDVTSTSLIPANLGAGVDRLSPERVRQATAAVVEIAEWVTLDQAAVVNLASKLVADRFETPVWNRVYHFADDTPRTANYVLLLDTLNFCFWGAPDRSEARWRRQFGSEWLNGYWALAAALKLAAESEPTTLDAARWADLTPTDLAAWLGGENELLLMPERAAAVREIGAWLSRDFAGQFVNVIEAVGYSAPGLATRLATDLASFRDVSRYGAIVAPFLKRAQICAADIFGAFGGARYGGLTGMAELTMFADYKAPQILRSLGVLRYAPELARRVDAQIELPAGSAEEVELRAATVQAVERIVAAMRDHGRAVAPYEVDWYLWEAAQSGPHTAKPYHRTRTIFY